jgi:hypothetical protein
MAWVLVHAPAYVQDYTGYSTTTAMTSYRPNDSIDLIWNTANATMTWVQSNDPNFTANCPAITYAYASVGNFTFTMPVGCSHVTANVWGGGGGGSGYTASFDGAGGAGGGYAQCYLALTPGTSVPITVGAAGAAGAYEVAAGAGGTSEFGPTPTTISATATGGAGGAINGGQNTSSGIGSVSNCLTSITSSGGYGGATGAGAGPGAGGGAGGNGAGGASGSGCTHAGTNGGSGSGGGTGGTCSVAGAQPGGGGGSVDTPGGAGEIIIYTAP